MQAVTLDIIANILCSAFSNQQIHMIFWFLKSNGVSQILSAKMLHNQNVALHSMCGIHTLEYSGAFGHRFFITHLWISYTRYGSQYSFGLCATILNRKWLIHASDLSSISTLKMLARPLMNTGMQDTGTRMQTPPL